MPGLSLLSEVTRKSGFGVISSAFDPTRTFGLSDLSYLLVQERF
jgi:hypothetical protein